MRNKKNYESIHNNKFCLKKRIKRQANFKKFLNLLKNSLNFGKLCQNMKNRVKFQAILYDKAKFS